MNEQLIQVSVGSVNELTKKTLEQVVMENPDIEVSQLPEDRNEQVHHVVNTMPDIVLIAAPAHGNDAASRIIPAIRQTTPRTRVVAVTSQGQPEEIVQVMRDGAIGYITEKSSATDITSAIFAAMQHGFFLYDKHVAARIVDEFHNYSRDLSHLSIWERIILDRIMKGHTHQKFLDEFGIEKNILEKHLGSIATKLYELNHRPSPREKWFDRLRRIVGLNLLYPNKIRDSQTAFLTRMRIKSLAFWGGIMTNMYFPKTFI